MTTDDEKRPSRVRSLLLIAVAALIWLGFAVSDCLKKPAPPPASQSIKDLALRHLRAESQNAFWTGGGK